MSSKRFNKLLKEHEKDLEYIIRMYCMNKIYLTSYQVNKVLKLRGEKKYPHYKLIGRKKVIVQ